MTTNPKKGIYESFVPWATGEWSFPATSNIYTDFQEKYARTPVRELISSTGGLALRQSVAARAGFQMITNVDLRNICRLEQCPEAGGLTYKFQTVAVTNSMGQTSPYTYVPGTNMTPADPTLAAPSATVAVYPAASFLQDLMLRQSAVNFVESYGAAQGNFINFAINYAVWAGLKTASSNIDTISGTNGTSANYAWTDIQNCVGLIKAARGKPNAFVTYPYSAVVNAGTTQGFEPFVLSNITSVQFMGGLAKYMETGTLPALMGLEVYDDNTISPGTAANCAATGAVLGAVLQKNEAVGWAQATDIETRIQRWELQVGEYMVSNIAGATALVLDPFVAQIEHP